MKTTEVYLGPYMSVLCLHSDGLGFLIPIPVLPTLVDNPTVRTFNNISVIQHDQTTLVTMCIHVNVQMTYPLQTYLASPVHPELLVDVLGTTMFSIPLLKQVCAIERTD